MKKLSAFLFCTVLSSSVTFARPPAGPILEALQALDAGNGPSDQRINFIWISEGYSAANIQTFINMAQSQWNLLVNTPPYKEYRTFLNGFVLPTVWYRSTPGTVLSFPTDFDAIYGKVTNWLPEFSVIILISDDRTAPDNYTHADDSFAYCSTSLPDIAVHEISHQFADLEDEYKCLSAATEERANVTFQTDRTLLKWRAWVDAATPIPTPDTSTYNNVVGLFAVPGCGANGVYHARRTCIMHSDYLPSIFCEICREAITLQFYKPKARVGLTRLPNGNLVPWTIKAKVLRPIQSFQPASAGVTLGSGQSATFSVQVRTTAHLFSYQWYRDGTAVAGAVYSSYTYVSDGLAHQIAVKVHNDSFFVRTEPANLLSDSVFWTVNEAGVQITSPSPGTVFRGALAVQSAVTAHAGQIQRVDYYAGNTRLASVSSPPYQFALNTAPEGSYTLRACAVSSVAGIDSFGWSSPVQVAALGWNLIHLGVNLPAGQGSAAFGLNDNGLAVGHIRVPVPNDSWGETHAYRTAAYSPVVPSTDIVDGGYNVYHSVLKSINNQGVAVGNLMDAGISNYQAQAIKALPGSPAEDIHTGGGGEYFSSAECINSYGTIAGWVAFFSPDAFVHAPAPTYLDPNGGYPNGSFRPSVIRGINNVGQMVGSYVNPQLGTTVRAFRVTLGQAHSYGLPRGPASGDLSQITGFSEAWAINDAGQVTGAAAFNGFHAFRTGPNAQIQFSDDLGTLGGAKSIGYGINGAGQVVGSADGPDGVPKAFYYGSAAMCDLNALMAFPPGWVLHQATGINVHSDISGIGTNGGIRQGFLLRASAAVPPPPVSISFPAHGATYIAPVGNLILRAQAGLSDSTDVRVSFYANGILLGTDTTAPFNVTWRSIGIGTYVLTATAIDGRGVSATSVPITITVQ